MTTPATMLAHKADDVFDGLDRLGGDGRARPDPSARTESM